MVPPPALGSELMSSMTYWWQVPLQSVFEALHWLKVLIEALYGSPEFQVHVDETFVRREEQEI
jgi:hypothetical protein